MTNGKALVGRITFVPKGKGKEKRQAKYGFIAFEQIRTPEGVLVVGLPAEELWLTCGLDQNMIGRDGLHVSVANMRDKTLLAEGSLIRFEAGPGKDGLLTAIEVEKFEPDPASALETAAIEPPVEKASAQPVFARNAVKDPVIVEETKPVETEALYARIEADPEARLQGVEAVLVSKATSSSETAWEALKPVVDGIVGLLKEAPIFLVGLAIDLGRLLWKMGKNFIVNRRARKSAA